MQDEFYLKDVCDVYPILKSPVLFVVLGEKGKEAFPFLKKIRGGLGDSVQIIQIAPEEYKIQDPEVEFADSRKDAVQWKEEINSALENTIIPILKTTSYTMKGMISVNVLVDVDDDESVKVREISEHIYEHLAAVYENSVDFYFYCFTAVKFKKEKRPVTNLEVIRNIREMYYAQQKDGWVRLVYMVSDLNEDDIYLSNNLEKKYLALTLNTFLQAGYHVDSNAAIFDSFIFADRMNIDKEFVFQAIGCAPLTLNTELLETYFRWKLIQYFSKQDWDDMNVLKNIFSSLEVERQTVEEAFEKIFPGYYENLEYIAFNKNAFSQSPGKYSNRVFMRRIYNNNYQQYYEENILTSFQDKFKVELGDNKRTLEGLFFKAVRSGKINPFHVDNYKKLANQMEITIHEMENELHELEKRLISWEDMLVSVNKIPFFRSGRINRLRRKKMKEWAEYRREILIQDATTRYLHMEREAVLKMAQVVDKCKRTAENYINNFRSRFSRLERSAFSYQTDYFEIYYSEKVRETMENGITEQEKNKLYVSFCQYMLDEKNNSVLFEEEMAEFLQIFWRQGNIKKELVEEILDRMKASNQKNVEDVLTQLYFSTIEAKNVNLRVIGLKSREENEICCFMGPSDNEFISFLSRYKQKDGRVRVLVVEQLFIPVVLYFKFNIPENEIRI